MTGGKSISHRWQIVGTVWPVQNLPCHHLWGWSPLIIWWPLHTMRHLTPLSSRNPRIIGVQQSVGERVWPSAMISCNISFLSFSLPLMHKMVNKCHLALLSREVPPGNDRTGGLLHCVYSVIALVCSFAYLIPLKSWTQSLLARILRLITGCLIYVTNSPHQGTDFTCYTQTVGVSLCVVSWLCSICYKH